jgi:hypothetical protein
MRWLPGTLLVLAALSGFGCAAFGSRGSEASVELSPSARLLPARVRRLTNLELERSLTAFIGIETPLAGELPPDVRQEGYTRNVSQDASSTWASRYAALVHALAPRASGPVLASLGCADLKAAACRASAVKTLGERAYRRPLADDERAELDRLVEQAASPGDDAAMALLLQALLTSPSFLYVTELGVPAGPGKRRLDDFELASQLSYLLRGGPPDALLWQAAARGELRHAGARSRHARRLLSMTDSRHQFRRFALEWLEVDSLLDTAKSSQLHPSYEALKPFMLAETENYVDEVMVNGGASVQSLLAGDFASVGPEMARFYGLSTYGARASLRGTGRRGVLQQASFLAAHAHEDVTSPVKRGDFVMRKLLCEKVKRPAEIGLEVVMPPPSRTLSNRERLSHHTADPGCAVCHDTLDAIGFTFESFDAIGAEQRRDHERPVDTRATVRLGQAAKETQDLRSSAELTESLLRTPVISECFARHAWRYFSAQADPKVEEAFLSLRAQLPDEQRDSLVHVLLAFIGSDLFTLRDQR